MKKKKCINPLKKNKYEIYYNLINSGIASLLVLLGALSTGKLNSESIWIAIFAALIVAVSKFKEYWDGEKKEYLKAFNFISF